MKRAIVAASFFLALAGSALAQAAPEMTIYYFDPGAGAQEPAQFEAKAKPLLEKLAPGVTLRAFGSGDELKAEIAKKAPDFLFIPPYLRKEVAGGAALAPLLIRERDRSTFYELVIVGPGKVDDLRGKTLAALADAVPPSVLEILFLGTPLRASDVRILQVGKEIDGVLAVGQGQAAGAFATPGSVDLVKKANPAVGSNLVVMHRVSTVPLATIFAFGAQDEAKRESVKTAFGGLHKSDAGRKLLKLVRADRLVVVDAALAEKIGTK